MALRIKIRLKFFLVIVTVSLLTGLSYLVMTNILLDTIIEKEMTWQMKNVYDDFLNLYSPEQDLKDFILRNERKLGGFVTVLSDDFEILVTTSPGLSNFKTMPPEHFPHISDAIQNENRLGFYYLEIIPKLPPQGEGP